MKKIFLVFSFLLCNGQGNAMKLTSPVFKNNAILPKKYTCEGQDVNPPLQWQDVPKGTKSFALIVEDPDAPSPQHPRPEGPWIHWIVFNIPATVNQLKENIAVSQIGAILGMTDSKKIAFHGACPPSASGTHRYFFKLYALDSMLDLKTGATKKELLVAMEGHIFAEAVLVGTYTR